MFGILQASSSAEVYLLILSVLVIAFALLALYATKRWLEMHRMCVRQQLGIDQAEQRMRYRTKWMRHIMTFAAPMIARGIPPEEVERRLDSWQARVLIGASEEEREAFENVRRMASDAEGVRA